MFFLCCYVLVFALSIIFLKTFFKEYVSYRKHMSRLPGPKIYPLLGNLPMFLCEEGTFFKRLRNASREYGPVYNLSAMYAASINIAGPEEYELVVSTMKNIDKGPAYTFLDRWLGQGLLTSTGSHWQTRRKILTPAFHFTILQKFVTVFNEEADRLTEILKKQVGEQMNVVPLVSQYTLNSIAETSMGTSLDLTKQDHKNYVSAIFKIGKIFFYRILRPWWYIPAIFYTFASQGKAEKRLVNILHDFTSNIIRSRANNFVKFEEENEYAQRKKLAMLDILLNAQIKDGIIDEKGVRDEVNTFMFEGQDTTSMSICFTLMLLAYHRDIQDLVYKEMVDLYGESNKHLSLQELNDLKYMEIVIKESLRLYPSVPFIQRSLEEDTSTKDGLILPKSAIVNIHIFDIHRNAKYWPNPDVFNPDRFLPENCTNRHPFAFVPFSAGPRNCIGQKFAMLEIKAVLYGILRNFVLVPVDTPDTIVLIPDIVLRTKGESVKVKFILRK